MEVYGDENKENVFNGGTTAYAGGCGRSMVLKSSGVRVPLRDITNETVRLFDPRVRRRAALSPHCAVTVTRLRRVRSNFQTGRS